MQDKAFANNYRRPIIGYERDINNLSRQDIAAFFAQNYGPDSLSIAIVGDLTASEAQRLAQKYFGNWQSPQRTASATAAPQAQASAASAAALGSQSLQRNVSQGPASAAHSTQAAAQMPAVKRDSELGSASDADAAASSRQAQAQAQAPTARPANLAQESQITVPSQAGPAAHLVFYRPAVGPDGMPIAVEMLAELMSGSRSSRLYKSLVTSGVLAAAARITLA